MDKTWITKPKNSREYLDGVEKFLNFAFENGSINGMIRCPCRTCYNNNYYTREVVLEHLLWYGFPQGYTNWICHGEIGLSSSNPICFEDYPPNLHNRNDIMQCSTEDGMRSLIQDALEQTFGESSVPSESTSTYNTLLQECEQPLYPGCEKFSKISFLVQLYHIKCLNGWTTKSFSMLLQLLKDAFPNESSLPSSSYEAKKLIKDLGLSYEKIHACPNDCMLYWGEKKDDISCYICKSSRWISSENKNDTSEAIDVSRKYKKPAKVLRYFPVIPRLKRLYMSYKTASSMRWHATDRKDDGILRHPADGYAWKSFDERYPDFASDSRNVRLGLATDGFNPFGIMSTTYSMWPVVLIPYNLPPWMCMKQSSFILSMLIPGEKGPGNDIDVFLQPLIVELKQLWVGVDAFDCSFKQNFQLRGALLWTINDFPAYASLSGWSTKGRLACPCCGKSTNSRWLKNGGKFCYMGHRRWLDPNHSYRFQKYQFDGMNELDISPISPSGSDVLAQTEHIVCHYGKASKFYKKRLREEIQEIDQGVNNDVPEHDNCKQELEFMPHNEECKAWKKRSIFFELPYWKFNLLRHNLDVMHIEKNVCDNFITTFLNIDGKTKDNLKARLDLQDMGIRHHLHPQKQPSGRFILPHACYTMLANEKCIFLKMLKELKVPDGYLSFKFSRGVNLKEKKIINLKSHDYHILMQDLLPLVVRASMKKQKEVVAIVSEISSFFKALCSKSLDPRELDQLESRVALALCHMEKGLSSEFFDYYGSFNNPS
ncbi:hypothetical protein AXF42_Ash018347 [Apostasia shenzhenica]|uniref:Transposase-associated domain-containing protein n=1 Tax=Apostasia shenzhenica TaxID=1088818 RepID=A0A2H9ZR83_9ASPA|nr:hypothetical protein AXF42_Ash018347 [Apostasia shenzhenica]